MFNLKVYSLKSTVYSAASGIQHWVNEQEELLMGGGRGGGGGRAGGPLATGGGGQAAMSLPLYVTGQTSTCPHVSKLTA